MSAPAPAAAAKPVRRAPPPLARFGVPLALAAMAVAGTVLIPGFASAANLTTILLHASINAILALGMTFVIVTAGIDLSVGSIVALGGVLAAKTLTSTALLGAVGPVGSALLAVVVGLGVGAAIGILNGGAVAYLRVAPFIVTLATMTIARGAARLVTGGVPVGYPDPGDAAYAGKVAALDVLHGLGGGRLPVPGLPGGFPVPALVMLLVIALGAFVLTRTRFGRYVYAVGGNEEASRLSGVPVPFVKLAVYAISGACSGLAAILLLGQLRSGGPDAGTFYELNAIAAAVIGGTSLLGGTGTAWGTLIGALLLGVLNNALDLLGVQAFWQEIAKGGIILLAVLFDVWVTRTSAAAATKT
ncbi:MAG: ABC transporter permease [Gemmatimonadales bacterium]|jgi:ribose/xylose/arabinose/galactoside ABC-type transport system permease subunit